MVQQRLVLHIRRYRSSIINMLIFSITASTIFSLFYTAMGEEAVITMFGIIVDSPYLNVIPGIGSGSTAWTLWLIFFMRILLFYAFAILGINLGSRIFPTTEDDGLEMILGPSPLAPRRFYLENVFVTMLLLMIVFIPMYLIMITATIIYSSAEIIPDLTLVFVSTYSVGLFHMAIVSLISLITFSRFRARTLGIIYLAASFIIETLADSPDFSGIANLSVNAYVKPMGPIASDYDWIPVMVIFIISIISFGFGWGIIRVQDLVERAGSERKVRLRNPLSGIISNRVSAGSFLGRKFPIFTDQIRTDLAFLLATLAFILFQQLALYNALPSVDTLAQVLAQSTSPMLSAFSQNHPLQESMLGFIVLKYYSSLWIFYGIFTLIIAGSIPNRDVRNDTHDMLFANNIPMTKLIRNRIAAMLLSISILIWTSFFAIRALQAGKVEIDFMIQFGVFLVMWLHYMGLGILLTGVAMIPTISKGKSIATYTFIFFVIFSFIPFLDSSIEFLKYVSYLSYFDPVGMVYEITSFWPQFLTSLGLFLGSCGFCWFMTKSRYYSTDLR